MGTEMQGKATLITGGASGIGLACARLFARQGMRVLIAYTDEAVGSFAAEALVEDRAKAPLFNRRIG